MPTIILNLALVRATAARVGVDLETIPREPITCELLAAMHRRLGLGLSELCQIADDGGKVSAAE